MSPATLSTLPLPLRYRIYDHLGVVLREPIQIPFDAGTFNIFCNADIQDTARLMQTCKVFHQDLSQVFYSTNQFIIDFKAPRGREFLQNLADSTIYSLTRLVIIFNHSLCSAWLSPYLRCHGGLQRYSFKLRNPFLKKDFSGDLELLIPSWNDIVLRLLSCMSTDRLQLALTCDNISHSAAERLVKPIVDAKKRLAELSIRLGPKKHTHLIRLASAAVAAVTKATRPAGGTFRYLDLPPELRTAILMYTDLITPLSEVNWSPGIGYFVRYSARQPCDEEELASEHYHYSCQFRDCADVMSCAGPAGTQVSLDTLEWANAYRLNKSIGCFCRRYHSVASSLQQCCCWEPPTSLFLVCRSVRDEAEEVFFANNRFVVTPIDDCYWSPKINPSHFEASVFLKGLRPSVLHSLRDLEIVFPPFEMHYCDKGSRVHRDWQDVIEQVNSDLRLDLLSIRIFCADAFEPDMRSRDPALFRVSLTRTQGLDIIETYRRILEPFSQLQGLQHFCFTLADPWRWSPAKFSTKSRGPYSKAELENWLGQALFGEHYAELRAGEHDRRSSQWLEWSACALA